MRVACRRARAQRAPCRCVRAAPSGQTVLTLADVLARARERGAADRQCAAGARRGARPPGRRVRAAAVEPRARRQRRQPPGQRHAIDRSAARRDPDVRAAGPPRRTDRRRDRPARSGRGAAVEVRTRDVLRDAASCVLPGAVCRRAGPPARPPPRSSRGAILQTADRRYRAGRPRRPRRQPRARVAGPRAGRARGGRGRSRRRAGRAARAARHRGHGRRAGQPRDGCAARRRRARAGGGPASRAARRSQAAIREADADVSLARTLAKPDYGVGVRYQREGGRHTSCSAG